MKKLLLIFLLTFSITSCLIVQPQKVKAQDYIAWVNQSILESGGYGMLYNWFCTQEQAAVEYGYLYNRHTINDSRFIAASGWHVPVNSEFTTMQSYLGGYSVTGGKLKEAGTSHWSTPNTGATNEVGFNGRGSGQRSGNDGSFSALTISSGVLSATNQYVFILSYNSSNGLLGTQTTNSDREGRPIRLIKDSTTLTNGQTGTYVDPSGIIYPTICIGTQEWVACNIMTKHYRNGDAIPEVTGNTAWAALTTGARCSYNNTESNAGATKKLSSSNSFIVPSDTEWNNLIDYLGLFYEIGGKLKETGTIHWNSPNTGATNEVGFNGVGSGARSDTGVFSEFKVMGYHWSTTPFIYDTESHMIHSLRFDEIVFDTTSYTKKTGIPIRLCDPNTLNAEGSVNLYTQNDGTEIPTIVINGVEWTMNLKETKWSDGIDIQNITDNTAWSLLQSAACCDINNDSTKR